MLDGAWLDALHAAPLADAHLALLGRGRHCLNAAAQIRQVIRLALVVIIKLGHRGICIARRTGPRGIARSSTAVQGLQLALDRGELLAEVEFLLLLRERLVHVGRNLLADLGNGRLLDEHLRRAVQAVVWVLGGKECWRGD